jgi:hypothetical protein
MSLLPTVPYRLPPSLAPLFPLPVNLALRPVLDVLRYETTLSAALSAACGARAPPPVLGATVSGHAHIHARIAAFAARWRALAGFNPAERWDTTPWLTVGAPAAAATAQVPGPAVHVFAADVERCFDSLPRNAVVQHTEDLLVASAYDHARYFTVVGSASSVRPSMRHLAYVQPVGGHRRRVLPPPPPPLPVPLGTPTHISPPAQRATAPPTPPAVAGGALWARGVFGYTALAPCLGALSAVGAASHGPAPGSAAQTQRQRQTGSQASWIGAGSASARLSQSVALTPSVMQPGVPPGPAVAARPQQTPVRVIVPAVQGTVTRLPRAVLLAAVRTLVYNTLLQSGARVLRPLSGVPQGSVLSTLLACLTLGAVDTNVVLPALHAANSHAASVLPFVAADAAPAQLVLRQVDDYLVLTTNGLAASTALSVLSEDLPGCAGLAIKPSKSVANFGPPVNQSSQGDATWRYSEWVTWNSLLIRSAVPLPAADAVAGAAAGRYGIEVRGDYARYQMQPVRSLLLLRGDATPGAWLQSLLRHAVPPLAAQLILFDARINPPSIAALNAYQACAALGVRCWAALALLAREDAAAAASYVAPVRAPAAWPDADLMRPHAVHFVLECAITAIEAFVGIAAGKMARERTVRADAGAFPLTRCQLRWLALQAFADTLTHPAALLPADPATQPKWPPRTRLTPQFGSPKAAQLWVAFYLATVPGAACSAAGFSGGAAAAAARLAAAASRPENPMPRVKVRVEAVRTLPLPEKRLCGPLVPVRAVARGSDGDDEDDDVVGDLDDGLPVVQLAKRSRLAQLASEDGCADEIRVLLKPESAATRARRELTWVRRLLPFLRGESAAFLRAISLE